MSRKRVTCQTHLRRYMYHYHILQLATPNLGKLMKAWTWSYQMSREQPRNKKHETNVTPNKEERALRPTSKFSTLYLNQSKWWTSFNCWIERRLSCSIYKTEQFGVFFFSFGQQNCNLFHTIFAYQRTHWHSWYPFLHCFHQLLCRYWTSFMSTIGPRQDVGIDPKALTLPQQALLRSPDVWKTEL